MITLTLNVEGMKCVMCEAHATEAIKKSFKVKSVTSSHKDKTIVITADKDIDDGKLKSVIEEEGFTVLSVDIKEEKKKKFLFFK